MHSFVGNHRFDQTPCPLSQINLLLNASCVKNGRMNARAGFALLHISFFRFYTCTHHACIPSFFFPFTITIGCTSFLTIQTTCLVIEGKQLTISHTCTHVPGSSIDPFIFFVYKHALTPCLRSFFFPYTIDIGWTSVLTTETTLFVWALKANKLTIGHTWPD